MNGRKLNLLLTVPVVALLAVGGTGLAVAQSGPPAARMGTPPADGMRGLPAQPVFDPAQLPEVKGKVAQYTLTPRGDVDGLILADGTEVDVPPYLSTQLVYAVRPGDAVTIHGLKARALPLVMAREITNDATGATVMARGMGPMHGLVSVEAQGRIVAAVHTPRGDISGVRLADGAIVRLPPPEAQRLAAQLAVGQTVDAVGVGYSGPLGRVVMARQIGPDKDHLQAVHGPHMGPGGMMGRMMERMHGGMMGHGPAGPGGPNGAPPTSND